MPDAVAIIKAQHREGDDRPEHVFSGSRGTLVKDRLKKAGSELSRVLGFEFRSHDLRRTVATRLAEGGTARENISALLNHVQGGPRATRVYDRYSRDREKRLALESWAQTLQAIIAKSDEEPAAVLPFRNR